MKSNWVHYEKSSMLLAMDFVLGEIMITGAKVSTILSLSK